MLLQMQKSGEQSGEIGLVGEGNPLFIEELAASVAEHAKATAAELPTTIRAIVSARLDALPPGERAVLLDAAVVGKVFWTGALERMSSGELDLAELLDSLEGRDLIRRESVSRLRGDQQFSFKHDLIRDAAYATLPRPQRRKRHEQVAAFLEETTSEIPAAASALAQHWREAGENRRAGDYFVVAGDQAGRGWAKEEAVGFYQQALDLIGDGDPELRRKVTQRQAVAVMMVAHVADAELLGRKSRQLAGGALVQREVVRCDVARDLVDPFDIVEAKLVRVGPDDVLGRRFVDAVGLHGAGAVDDHVAVQPCDLRIALDRDPLRASADLGHVGLADVELPFDQELRH